MTPYFRVREIAIAVLLLISASFASPNTSLHNEIQKTYNFHPHELTDEQLKAKSAILDKFWSEVKSNQSIYLPELRRELADLTNPVFFFYDGSKLLLSLSKTPEDKKIVMIAFMHCDLHDLQLLDYFMTVHSFAVEGLDTTDLAFRILEIPGFKVFIPMHVMWLHQDLCLAYLLFPIDQKYWLQRSIDRFKVEKDLMAQKSLAVLLWFAQTDSSDAALRSAEADASKPAELREGIGELFKQKDQVSLFHRSVAFFRSESSIRQHRREIMKHVSDEFLDIFYLETQELMAKR